MVANAFLQQPSTLRFRCTSGLVAMDELDLQSRWHTSTCSNPEVFGKWELGDQTQHG